MYRPVFYIREGLPARPKTNNSATAGSRSLRNTEIPYWKTAERRNTRQEEARDNSLYVLCGVLFNVILNSEIPLYKTAQQSYKTLKSLFYRVLRLELATSRQSTFYVNIFLHAMPSCY
jgi:hypothetical protein